MIVIFYLQTYNILLLLYFFLSIYFIYSIIRFKLLNGLYGISLEDCECKSLFTPTGTLSLITNHKKLLGKTFPHDANLLLSAQDEMRLVFSPNQNEPHRRGFTKFINVLSAILFSTEYVLETGGNQYGHLLNITASSLMQLLFADCGELSDDLLPTFKPKHQGDL